MLEVLQAWPAEASWAPLLQEVAGVQALAEALELMAPSGSEACSLLHRRLEWPSRVLNMAMADLLLLCTRLTTPTR